MMKFASLMTSEPSATMAINSLALQKKAAGERVYNLAAGEPMVATDPKVIEAATRAMNKGKTHYPPVAGIPELRAAASKWMNENYQTNFSSAECLVTAGGKFGLFALCQALLNPGDEVLIVAPYWVSYPSMVKMFGGVSKFINTKESLGWRVTIKDLAKAVTSKTKIIFFNNGSNPTGVLYSLDEIKEILAFAKEHDLLVVSDEVYSGLVYDDEEFVSCGSFPEYRERVVIVQSCSKHFAMTGWRVGFVLGPENLIKILATIQGQSTSGAASISQWAAVAAFVEAGAIVPRVREVMQKRRDFFLKTFEKLFSTKINTPSSGLYFFVPLKKLGSAEKDSAIFCRHILEVGNIAIVPGVAFGEESYARFSFGASEEELGEALGALARFLKL